MYSVDNNLLNARLYALIVHQDVLWHVSRFFQLKKEIPTVV